MPTRPDRLAANPADAVTAASLRTERQVFAGVLGEHLVTDALSAHEQSSQGLLCHSATLVGMTAKVVVPPYSRAFPGRGAPRASAAMDGRSRAPRTGILAYLGESGRETPNLTSTTLYFI
ncbi:MAG: hypothetical protein AAFO08_02325 [Pseudomonadota bacterium]